MIHLRPIPNQHDETLAPIRAAKHRQLQNEIAEARMDARLPRHFSERQQWLKHGKRT